MFNLMIMKWVIHCLWNMALDWLNMTDPLIYQKIYFILGQLINKADHLSLNLITLVTVLTSLQAVRFMLYGNKSDDRYE